LGGEADNCLIERFDRGLRTAQFQVLRILQSLQFKLPQMTEFGRESIDWKLATPLLPMAGVLCVARHDCDQCH
jgi:hypothetical protein